MVPCAAGITADVQVVAPSGILAWIRRARSRRGIQPVFSHGYSGSPTVLVPCQLELLLFPSRKGDVSSTDPDLDRRSGTGPQPNCKILGTQNNVYEVSAVVNLELDLVRSLGGSASRAEAVPGEEVVMAVYVNVVISEISRSYPK